MIVGIDWECCLHGGSFSYSYSITVKLFKAQYDVKLVRKFHGPAHTPPKPHGAIWERYRLVVAEGPY